MNADVWKPPDGRIGTEIERKWSGRGYMVRIAIAAAGFPVVAWFSDRALTPEPARYEGARGGRVSG